MNSSSASTEPRTTLPRPARAWALGLTVLIGGLWLTHARASGAGEVTFTGWLDVTWTCGDPEPGRPDVEYRLSDGRGGAVVLSVEERLLAPYGGARGLMGQKLVVTGQPAAAAHAGGAPVLRAAALKPAPDSDLELVGATTSAATGTHAYLTLLLKFADKSATPNAPAHFTALMGGTAPGLDHYYRTISHGKLSLKGSSVAGWLTLPQRQAAYVLRDGSFNRDLAIQDAIRVADRQIDFGAFQGINLVFNTNPFPASVVGYGGWQWMELEGQPGRTVGITWIGRYDQGIMAHEIGHSLGLAHSSGPYSATYDSEWDVMSYPLQTPHRTYGYVAQDMIAHYKEVLGWVPEARRAVIARGQATTLTLACVNQPALGRDFQVAQIPIDAGNSVFYTVEARRRSGYDTGAPADAVVLHLVDNARYQTNRRVAQVVDPDGNKDPNDAGAAWLPGETFRDAARAIRVSVLAKTAAGYTVRISNAGPIRGTIQAPAHLNFGKVKRKKSKWLTLEIGNSGDDDLEVTLTPPGKPFGVAGGGQTALVPPGARQTFRVRFRPKKRGKARGALSLRTSDPQRPAVAVALTGAGK